MKDCHLHLRHTLLQHAEKHRGKILSLSAAAECICLQYIALSMDTANIMAWATDAAIEWVPALEKDLRVVALPDVLVHPLAELVEALVYLRSNPA